jgi:hypothetical protein
MLKHCVLRAPVEEVGWSDLAALSLWIQLLNDDDLLGSRVRQRPQQHGIDDAEYGRAGADSERQRRDDQRGKPRMF